MPATRTAVARVVVDTSALVDAADADRAPWGAALEHLERTSEATAPVLLASEAGHVVHAKRPGAFGASAAERMEQLSWMLAPITLVTDDAAARRRAGALAEEERLSFYDAEFLELALRDGATLLLTQDSRLLAAGKRRLGALAKSLDEAAQAIAGGKL